MRLDDHPVAGTERRSDRLHREEKRKVERTDHANNADRKAIEEILALVDR